MLSFPGLAICWLSKSEPMCNSPIHPVVVCILLVYATLFKCIIRGLVLRLIMFSCHLVPQCEFSPSEVVQWSNHRVMEWLRSVDLAEYAPNLRGSGVHGGLIVSIFIQTIKDNHESKSHSAHFAFPDRCWSLGLTPTQWPCCWTSLLKKPCWGATWTPTSIT